MLNKKDNIGALMNEVRMLPAGRKLLDAIYRECGHNKVVFHPESERKSIFNQGKQSVSVWLHDNYENYKKSIEK